MGIRFYCPNGHKLNVKEFLAGQRGICPRCNAKVDIPFESTRAPGTKDLPIAAEWEAKQKDLAQQRTQQAADINLNNIQPALGVSSGSPAPFAPVSPAAPSRLPDPFEGSQDTVWYVTAPAGGQLGPLTPTAVKTMLAQRKIEKDTLVWREGWTDWKKGAEVFESLAD
ncbi:MAG: DUF4339 domain-containing protein [Planctomycetia bacterium]|nr:DUF4339 domain-containing protein [Planctomycetia bacterium]